MIFDLRKGRSFKKRFDKVCWHFLYVNLHILLLNNILFFFPPSFQTSKLEMFNLYRKLLIKLC